METKINCPICKSKNCFESIDKDVTSYLCLSCGYTSNSLLKQDSDSMDEIMKTTPQLVKDLQIYDFTRELYWIPTVINMGDRGIIYPEGTTDSWKWKYAKVVDVPEDERDQYEGHDKRLDLENPQKFGQFEFTNACMAMGIIKNNG